MDKQEIITKFNIAANSYYSGKISRKELAEIALELESQTPNNNELKALITSLSKWNINQGREEFTTTRREFYKYQSTSEDEDIFDSLNQNIITYLASIGLPDNSTKEDIKPVFKKAIQSYLNNEFSEIFLMRIAEYLMVNNPGDGFNLQDKVLLGLLIIVQDWFMYLEEDVENAFLEPELKEYLEFETGFEAMDSKEYYEKEIKPKLKKSN